jgi:hypothetical protein
LASHLPQKNPKPRAKAPGRVKTALTFPVTDDAVVVRPSLSKEDRELLGAAWRELSGIEQGDER